MATDIFKFWANIDKADKIHPDDRCVFERVKQHNFCLECLPGAYAGPLKTAPVVLLYLSPGFSPQDLEDAKSKQGQNRYVVQRSGKAKIPGPDEHPAAWEWYRERMQVFGDPEELRDKVAFLNIGAYKSTTFNDHPLLASLPSCRVSLDWAQSKLFPKAITGERIVICMRSVRYWGLELGKQYGRSLYAPETTPNGHMRLLPLRTKIVTEVKKRLKS